MLAQPVSPFARVIKALATDLQSSLDATIDPINDRLLTTVNNLQNTTWNRISPVLIQVATKPTGTVDDRGQPEVINNSHTADIIRQASEIYAESSFGSTYVNAINRWTNIYTQVRRDVERYYEDNISGEFDRDRLDSIERSERELGREELTVFLELEIVSEFRGLLTRLVQQQIPLNEFLDEARSFVRENGTLGRQFFRVEQIIETRPNQFAMNLSKTIANSLQLEWVKYTGPSDEKNREFCRPKADKYYHIKEVQLEWPLEAPWDGMIPNTNGGNIVVNRGGFNCRHNIVYVRSIEVPADVRRRAGQKGYISGILTGLEA